jgi:hypothetical protein
VVSSVVGPWDMMADDVPMQKDRMLA